MTEDIKPLNLSSDQPVVKPVLSPTDPKKQAKLKMASLFLGLIILGLGSGYGLSRLNSPAAKPQRLKSVEEGITVGSTYGVDDEKAFTDSAQGKLTAGGIDGEGSHHLVREGGESQNVYLTSSIIDLDQFVDRAVKIWGETFEAQKAGWLMDVGRLQVLE